MLPELKFGVVEKSIFAARAGIARGSGYLWLFLETGLPNQPFL
jgi:hypothetical protein